MTLVRIRMLRAVASGETNSTTCVLNPRIRKIIARKESVRMSHSRSRKIDWRSKPSNSRPAPPVPTAFCSSCWQQGADRM